MRPRPLLMATIATLLIVSVVTARVAQGQPATGAASWGEHALQAPPYVAHLVDGGTGRTPGRGGMLGLCELDTASVLFLLAGIAFLAYRFYWHPVHPVSSFLRLVVQSALAFTPATYAGEPRAAPI